VISWILFYDPADPDAGDRPAWRCWKVGDYRHTGRRFPTLREACAWLAEQPEEEGRR
jgi:hypothetical protein